MRMRFFLGILMVSLLIGACSKETETKQVQDVETEETQVTEKEKTSEKETQGAKTSEPSGLAIFKPEVGMVKTFIVEGENQTYTEEYVHESEEYIQKVTKIGEAATVQVYKWTEKEISLVFEDRTPDDPYKNYISELNNPGSIENYSEEETSDWELIETNKTIEVPSGEYTNVIVFKKVTNEVEDAETIYVNYFAPGIGLIKEEFELTGDQGYSAAAVLQSVEIK
ncbi:hypothetical protein [Robertmurraya sp. FSL R5-0851]|uniref:hypothetical protein n=1 Tax=Robertmurraya sp. FSL R5-0851 TaxID=2921584 RepID=UPI0030F7ED6A